MQVPGKVSQDRVLFLISGSALSPDSPRDLTPLFLRGPFPRQAQGNGNRMAQNSSFGRLACLFLDRQREKGTRTKNTDFQPDCLFLDQQGEKGTFKLKTRVLDALDLQERPLLSDSGRCLGSLAIAFSPCLSRKRLFQGTLGMLTTAFSPCLSRKRQFQPPPQEAQERPFSDDVGRNVWPLASAFSLSERGNRQIARRFCLFAIAFSPSGRGKRPLRAPPNPPSEVPFRTILEVIWGSSRLPFPSQAEGKVTCEAAFASSRLPFPPQGEGKGHCELPLDPTHKSLFGQFWMPALAPREA